MLPQVSAVKGLWRGLSLKNMAENVEFNGQEVKIRRRAFQKRLGVCVYPTGEIRVSANKTLSQKAILRFLEEQRGWIEKSLEEAKTHQRKYPPKFFRSGEIYPYLGHDYELHIKVGEAIQLQFQEGTILFTTPEEESGFSEDLRSRYLQAFKKSYREVAETIMGQRLQYYSQQMQLFPSGVQFRGQKSIWGSCSPRNKISLNFKLIVAPIQVVDYVLIHELAHIRHKDHSKQFWDLVEQHTPHRHYSRVWLREHQSKADFL
jgi:predicted metal-dependent hydrolase